MPSFFTGIGTFQRPVLRSIALGAVAVVVVLDGSRNLWSAVIVASAVVAIIRVRGRVALRLSRRGVVLIGALVATGVLAAMASGLANPLLDRLTNVVTLGGRGELWSASVTAWLQRPVFGWGAGSYPFLLQQTGYFQTNLWAPLHPDSVVFQLLPETGLFGLVAAACVTGGVAVALRRARPLRWTAVWATLVFALAGIAANPTDFGFLIAVMILWLAVASPRRPPPSAWVAPEVRYLPRLRYSVALVVMLVTTASTLTASLYWYAARVAVAGGDLRGASIHARVAVTLDPGEAIYRRGYGSILTSLGEASSAIPQLLLAADANPGDPTILRSLAIAEYSGGDRVAAVAAAQEAVRLQALSVPNLLLLAQLLQDSGAHEAAREVLSKTVGLWPVLATSPGWPTLYSQIASPREALVMAADHWDPESAPSGPFAGVWLAVLTDRHDLLDRVLEAEPNLESASTALWEIVQCQPAAAGRTLSAARRDRYYDTTYWTVRLILDSLSGSDRSSAVAALTTLNGSAPGTNEGDVVSVLRDQSTFGSRDVWGYHRFSLGLDPTGFDVLLRRAAGDLWIDDPRRAAAQVDAHLPLSSCP